MFGGLRVGFLYHNGEAGPQAARHGRPRLQRQLRPRLAPALARGGLTSAVHSGFFSTREIATAETTLRGVKWDPERRHAAFHSFLTDPSRAEFEYAWAMWAFGTPHTSDEDSEPDAPQHPGPITAQAVRGTDRDKFLRWLQRKKARQTPAQAEEWQREVEDNRQQLELWKPRSESEEAQTEAPSPCCEPQAPGDIPSLPVEVSFSSDSAGQARPPEQWQLTFSPELLQRQRAEAESQQGSTWPCFDHTRRS